MLERQTDWQRNAIGVQKRRVNENSTSVRFFGFNIANFDVLY